MGTDKLLLRCFLRGIAEPFLNLFELSKSRVTRFLKRSSLSRNVAMCDRQKDGSIKLVTFKTLKNSLFGKSGFKGAKTTAREYI